jgi:3-hydroxybutyryl-CoA dehydratase
MTDLMVPHGLYFEDYAVGQSLMTQGRTITEADVVNFAALSGDWNSIHTNAVSAAEGMFGERIAHGLLGLSIATGLAERTGLMRETVIAFMGLDWKFKGVIKLGDTITARLTVAECRAMRRLGGGIITFDVELLNQRSEAVQRGTWSMLVKSRPAEA